MVGVNHCRPVWAEHCILYVLYFTFIVCQPLHYCPGWLWRDGSGGNIARGTLSTPYQVREGLTEKPRIEDISEMSSCPVRVSPTHRWGVLPMGLTRSGLMGAPGQGMGGAKSS